MKEKKEENSVYNELDKMINDKFDDILDLSKVDGKVNTWYDSGIYSLNYAMSKNLRHGIPAGRIVSYSGLSSTGKSLLSAVAMKDPKLDMCIILETEGGGSAKELIEFAEVNTNKVRIIKAHTFVNYRTSKKDGKSEEVADDKFPVNKVSATHIYHEGATRLLKKFTHALEMNPKLKDAKILIILDSLGNLQSIRELNGGFDMGKRAQEIGSFFRTFDVAFEKSNISFLFTNKLYTNLGNQYDPWKETGGLNADYNPSISVRFANTALTDDKTETEIKEEKERRKSSLGNSLTTIKANIKKSRFGTAGRNALFLFDFAVGPVKLSGLFTLLKDFGVITGNRTYSIKGWNNDKSFYKKDFLKLLLKDEEANINFFQNALEQREIELKQDRRKQLTLDIDSEDEIYEDIDESIEDDNYQEMMEAMEESSK